jgi:hypothetical protein
MSTKQVRNEIVRFLASSNPEVLCIRGNWGTGKTFSWNETLVANSSRLALGKYAYVSLFGLNTIDDVKQAIFHSTISKDRIGKPFSFEDVKTTWESGKNLLKQASSVVTKAFGEGYQVVGMAVTSLLIRDQIVCIDDLERKGEGLRSADVLGYISQLKEERNCKIVLLLNDEQLEDREQFQGYLEKVVDINLRYAPTSAESVDIALGGIKESRTAMKTLVHERATKLGIDNIRVIRKIYRLVGFIEPMLRDFDSDVLNSVASSLVLFGWAHYQPELAPSIAFIRDERSFWPQNRNEIDPKPEETEWRKLLEEYGYRYTDAFDLVLLDGVSDGYFRQESVTKHAQELNERTASERAHSELNEAWRAYHRSFVNTAEDVVNPLRSCFMKNAHFLSLNDLNSILNLTRSLGFPEIASEMLKKYIDVKKDVRGAFDLGSLYLTRDDDLAEDVKAAIIAAARSQIPTYNIDEMFLKLAKDGFNAEINERLAALPVSEYIRVFKAHEGEEFDDIINGVRQWLNLMNPTESITTIMDKSALAFIEIGKESAINAYRVRRWGLVERYEARRSALVTQALAATTAD